METNPNNVTRRQFIGRSVLGLSAAATGGLGLFSGNLQAGPGDKPNPFALNTEGLRETDPKLISHAESLIFPGHFPEARRISVSGEKLFVAAGNHLRVLNLKGEEQLAVEFAEPVRCAAGTRDGRIFIGLKSRVEMRDSKGSSLSSWIIPGEKTWLSGMAVGKEDLYLADSGNRVVLRYNFEGKVLGRIGEKNAQRGVPGIILPSPYLQVALGKDGLLRVNNPGRHRSGCVYSRWRSGKCIGVLRAVVSPDFVGVATRLACAVLPDGRCITSEKGVPRVKLYDTDGTFKSVVARAELFPNNARSGAARRADGLLGGLDVAVDDSDRVYVMDLVSGQVRVMIPVEKKS